MSEINPQPLTNRSLFAAGPDARDNVELGASDPDWYRYALGYRMAAEMLVDHLSAVGRAADYVCLPITFLFRHYVELSLKSLLIDLGDLTDTKEEVPGHHPLIPLWARVQVKLLAYDSYQDREFLGRATALIEEFDRFDPGSFSFRYPFAKDGTRLLPPDLVVSVVHVRDVMKELVLILDGIADFVSTHITYRDYLDDEADYHTYYQ